MMKAEGQRQVPMPGEYAMPPDYLVLVTQSERQQLPFLPAYMLYGSSDKRTL
jgi:hypothetical protein